MTTITDKLAEAARDFMSIFDDGWIGNKHFNALNNVLAEYESTKPATDSVSVPREELESVVRMLKWANDRDAAFLSSYEHTRQFIAILEKHLGGA